MKAPLSSLSAGLSLGLLASVLLSSSALAGPGPQYWQNVGRTNASATTQTKPAATAAHLCAGAETVAVTTMKPALPNGRGPLVEVQTGTKTVCHMCPVTTTVRTNSLPNGRGTWTTTEVTKTGVEHTCTSCTTVASL